MPSLWVTGRDGALVPLEAEGYANEREFQSVLAENPAVLAGALARGEEEAWLLIDRELPIKAVESDSGTWRLDHLFVSSDGRPVLVEVKRSRDPRARREVVAQMLDYAASFDGDWDADRLRLRREQRLLGSGTAGAAHDEMDTFLTLAGLDDEDELWALVQTQIDAGRLRLLFVADRLSPTLVRLIEYLDHQLRTAEVVGVEVVRHADAAQEVVAYQPVVHGASSAEAQRKAPATPRTREDFEQVFLARHDSALLEGVNALVQRAEEIGGFESIGTSGHDPALFINLRTNGGAPTYRPFHIRPRRNKLVVRVKRLRLHQAFSDEAARSQLLTRVAEAAGLPALHGNPDGAPWVPLDRLVLPGVADGLGDVLEWIAATADAATAAAPGEVG